MHKQAVLVEEARRRGAGPQEDPVRNDLEVQLVAGLELEVPSDLVRQDDAPGPVDGESRPHGN